MTYPLMTDGKTDWRKVEAARALASTFGAEYDALTSDEAAAVILDCVADGEGVEDYAEYRRSIGVGNLASYAQVQIGRFARKDAREREAAKARAAYEAEAQSFGPQITITTTPGWDA